jgi:hypothetical protein
VDKEGYHAGAADIAAKLDYGKVMKASMGNHRRHEMLNKHTRYGEGAKDV